MNELGAAILAARKAGEVLIDGWNQLPGEIHYKTDVDLVTEYDKKAESAIVEILRNEFPSYGFMAEEGTITHNSEEIFWIVDPLDGTTNFSRRYPWFAVSIALYKNQRLVLGVVFNPVNNELFVGECGKGATLNGRAIHVSQISGIDKAVLASGFYFDTLTRINRNERKWREAIRTAIGVRCDGSAALDLCSVACGRFDGYWEEGLDAWDVAAGAIIVQEAGGMVSDYHGKNDFLFKKEIVAAPVSIHPALIKQIINS